jgi:hypothetical protein
MRSPPATGVAYASPRRATAADVSDAAPVRYVQPWLALNCTDLMRWAGNIRRQSARLPI